jgi:hypothetical protein
VKALLATAAITSLLTTTVNATDYYVDALSGLDANSGLSPNSAWRSISKVNSVDFHNGDTIKLKRGQVWNETLRLSATIRGDGASGITIEDYGSGALPFLNGNTTQPISINCESDPGRISGLTIRNIDISGQDWTTKKTAHLSIRYVDGVTLDGLFGDGFRDSKEPTQEGKNAVSVYRSTGPIIVKNTTLFNWGPLNLPTTGADSAGIAIIHHHSGSYNIHNNTVHHVNGDCLQIAQSTANGQVHNNTFYNAGENAIDIKGTSNVAIYDNEFYRERGFGLGGTGSEGALIVVHGWGLPATNNVLRTNKFRNCVYHGISVAHGDAGANQLKVDSNYFKNCKDSIRILNGCSDVQVSNNVFHDAMGGYAIQENNTGAGSRIVDNTIYEGRIELLCSNQTEVVNNIAYLTSDTYALTYSNCGVQPAVNHNLWYNPEYDKRLSWKERHYASADYSAWVSEHHGELFTEDPLFSNPQSGDFSIQPNSPAIDAGTGTDLNHDFEGNAVPMGNAPDIGAIEFHKPIPAPNNIVIEPAASGG